MNVLSSRKCRWSTKCPASLEISRRSSQLLGASALAGKALPASGSADVSEKQKPHLDCAGCLVVFGLESYRKHRRRSSCISEIILSNRSTKGFFFFSLSLLLYLFCLSVSTNVVSSSLLSCMFLDWSFPLRCTDPFLPIPPESKIATEWAWDGSFQLWLKSKPAVRWCGKRARLLLTRCLMACCQSLQSGEISQACMTCVVKAYPIWAVLWDGKQANYNHAFSNQFPQCICNSL